MSILQEGADAETLHLGVLYSSSKPQACAWGPKGRSFAVLYGCTMTTFMLHGCNVSVSGKLTGPAIVVVVGGAHWAVE